MKKNKERRYDKNLWKEINKRDGGRCINPLCFNRGLTNQHHMHDWSSYPSKRFDADNIVTLCSSDKRWLLPFKTDGCHQKFHKWMGGYNVSCTDKDLYAWFVFNGIKFLLKVSTILLITIIWFFYER